MSEGVLIVGAGLAGLACARRLAERGTPFTLIEAASRVGGRVITDEVDGFRIDRGFQVLLDSYPEARTQLDLPALRLGAFAPGALVRDAGRFHRVVDPWRAPLAGLGTLRAPFVRIADGLRMARLRSDALAGRTRTTGTAAEELVARGFSDGLRSRFFTPFFGGVTLDPQLSVPSHWLLSLFGWFARGSATLPASGMQAIPEQMAAGLPEGTLRLDTPVASVELGAVTLQDGRRLEGAEVVLATDATTTARLLDHDRTSPWHGTTTLCFAADRSPVGEPILVLNGEGPEAGPVNHLCVLSDAQPGYAPAGAALISVSVVGVPTQPDSALETAVRAQLEGWYPGATKGWRLLRVDRVPCSLPTTPWDSAPIQTPAGIHLAGDQCATPSIQGALESGRRAADRCRVTSPG